MNRWRGMLLAILLITFTTSTFCTSQDCDSLKSASAVDAVNSLDHGQIRSASCAWIAFQLIQHLPQGEAVTTLIKYLGYKRPLTGERYGPRPYPLYPAVEALADIGPAAEPALIEFVAQDEIEGGIEYLNALDALALIQHSDVVPTIKLLRERSAALSGTPGAARLQSAAQYMLKKYCPGKLLQTCKERLRYEHPEN